MRIFKKTTWFFVFTVFFFFPNIFATEVTGSTKAQEGNLVFILDASGSMWGQVEGKAKIDIAKEVLAGLIMDLPEGLNVGLVAYGHRRKGACAGAKQDATIGQRGSPCASLRDGEGRSCIEDRSPVRAIVVIQSTVRIGVEPAFPGP